MKEGTQHLQDCRKNEENKMKYGYKIVRKLSPSSLKAICVEHNWYNTGDIIEYMKMLDMARKEDITSDDLVEIATDIIEHTAELSMNDFIHVCDLILRSSHSFMTEQ